MIKSLIQNAGNSLNAIYVLSLDDEVFDYFVNEDKIRPIRLVDIESHFPELHEVKPKRSYVEYIFTLSPFLPLYILKNFKEVKRITTLDADILFFDNPHQFIEALGNNKIGLTPHSFPEDLKQFEIWGKYNVSFQSFPCTEESLKCLNKWAINCLEYCGDQLDRKRFADQKYLDDWKADFSNIMSFDSPLVGLAPWNIKKYRVIWRDNVLFLDNKRVLFYHFHHVRIKSRFHIINGLEKYSYNKPSKHVIKLYFYYWNLLRGVFNNSDKGISRNNTNNTSTLESFYYDLKNSIVLFKFGFIRIKIDLRSFINLLPRIWKKFIWRV